MANLLFFGTLKVIKLSKGLVQVYTGDGKGKTTAAIGLIIRAHGNQLKTGLVQFLKGVASGELVTLEKLGITFWQFGSGEFIMGAPTKKDRELAQTGLQKVEEIWQDYDLLVLDEISYLVTCGLLGEEVICEFIMRKPPHLELVLTGRSMPESILAQADLITEMKKIRHPYDLGISARKGIEY